MLCHLTDVWDQGSQKLDDRIFDSLRDGRGALNDFLDLRILDLDHCTALRDAAGFFVISIQRFIKKRGQVSS